MSELIVANPIQNVQLVATSAIEMSSAQADITSWLEGKLASINAEIFEMCAARDEAKKHKWKTSTFSSMISKARVREVFYEKVLEAVKAGYTIVPNFPIDVFAIRVAREYPAQGEQNNPNYPADWEAEKPEALALGEGNYVSVKPNFYRRQEDMKDMTGKVTGKRHYVVPTSFQEAEFPVMAAHPVVMQATAEARDRLLFDQIGICPPTRRKGKGDPLIIGQILETVPKWGEPPHIVSFLLAWHLDLRTL